MARPCKKRTVCLKLKAGYFRPEEFAKPGPVDVVLEVDEIEAVRLADLDEEYQVAAARKMGVSRSTFSNIISRAHHKIAEALIQGKAIRINCPKLVKKMQRMGERHE
jgi:uncharacterized protein